MSLFCWTQRKTFWRMWETEQFWGTIDFHSFFFPMDVNGAPKQPGYKLSSEYLPLCSAEQRHSYRFGTTWGWVNDDRIFIFGWTIPLSPFAGLHICSRMSRHLNMAPLWHTSGLSHLDLWRYTFRMGGGPLGNEIHVWPQCRGNHGENDSLQEF